MNGTGDHHVKLSKPSAERQSSHVFSHMWKLDLKEKQVMKENDGGG
jgi:hypothetical protein